jgi:hypothetical protein
VVFQAARVPQENPIQKLRRTNDGKEGCKEGCEEDREEGQEEDHQEEVTPSFLSERFSHH